MEQIISINLFRNDITPAWADPDNKSGGEYLITLDDCTNPVTIDEYWQELVIKVIGETFTLSEQV